MWWHADARSSGPDGRDTNRRRAARRNGTSAAATTAAGRGSATKLHVERGGRGPPQARRDQQGSPDQRRGRWADTGWIFTFGEAGSIAIFSYGVVDAIGNSNDNKAPWLIIGGILAFGSFKAIDIVDAFSGPGRHNRKYRAIRERMGNPTPLLDRVKGGLTLTRTGGFGGVSLTF